MATVLAYAMDQAYTSSRRATSLNSEAASRCAG